MAPLGIDTRGGGPDPGPASPGAVRYTARSLRLGRPWTAQGDDVRPPPPSGPGGMHLVPLAPHARGPGGRPGPRPPGGVMTSRDVMAGPGIRRWHGSRVQAREVSGGPARDLRRRGWREATPRLRSRPASRSDPRCSPEEVDALRLAPERRRPPTPPTPHPPERGPARPTLPLRLGHLRRGRGRSAPGPAPGPGPPAPRRGLTDGDGGGGAAGRAAEHEQLRGPVAVGRAADAGLAGRLPAPGREAWVRPGQRAGAQPHRPGGQAAEHPGGVGLAVGAGEREGEEEPAAHLQPGVQGGLAGRVAGRVAGVHVGEVAARDLGVLVHAGVRPGVHVDRRPGHGEER